NTVWTACRIDAPGARTVVRTALIDLDETVRQAALHAVSVWRDRDAGGTLLRHLWGGTAHNRRAAAEALGRLGDRSAVPALLPALDRANDEVLTHSLTYALIEIGDRDGTAAGLRSANFRVRRAAMIALDQMDGGSLEPAVVTAELTCPDPALKETAWWIASRHPEWGAALAGFLRERVAGREQTAAERETLVRDLARFARGPAIQEMVAERLRDAATPTEACQTILRAMSQAGLREVPAAWVQALTHVLGRGDAALKREAAA